MSAFGINVLGATVDPSCHSFGQRATPMANVDGDYQTDDADVHLDSSCVCGEHTDCHSGSEVGCIGSRHLRLTDAGRNLRSSCSFSLRRERAARKAVTSILQSVSVIFVSIGRLPQAIDQRLAIADLAQ